jgi:hypothetical protein
MWAKLDRAELLLNSLNIEVDSWHAAKPYKITTKPNEDYTCYSTTIEIDPEPRIARWSLMYSDFIHNLRCALDHMVWAIALDKDPALATAHETQLSYPIWDNPPNADAKRRIALLKGSPAYGAIEFMQPHNRPSAAYRPYHPLSLLRDLDNANKHKLLYLAMPGIAEFTYRLFANRAPDEGNPKYGVFKGQIKGGAEIARLFFDRPHPEAKIDFDFAMILAILHKKSSATGKDRDDYSALGAILINEVVGVIGAVTSTVP